MNDTKLALLMASMFEICVFAIDSISMPFGTIKGIWVQSVPRPMPWTMADIPLGSHVPSRMALILPHEFSRWDSP